MPFCSYCGSKVEAGARFCSCCGKALDTSAQNEKERSQVYQGKIRKCPSCGAEVESFTAICPECGHEFNSGQVASSIQAFADKLHYYDMMIASSPLERTGWGSWSLAGKIGWVFLNIYTFYIPLLFYLVLPKRFKAGSFSQQKTSFIENYVFPNEREAILEAILFIKAQLTTLVNGTANSADIYWERVWSSKAMQLCHKAEIIMPNDPVVDQERTDIVLLNRSFKRKVSMRKTIVIVLVLLVAAVIFFTISAYFR